MSEINTFSEGEAVERILEPISLAEAGEAPFALVLGAGFSHGLVPTVREVVKDSLPVYIHALRKGISFPLQTPMSAAQRMEIASKFWRQFVERNSNKLKKNKLELKLDDQTGLPIDYSEAYKAAFDSKFSGAVGNPKHAREFQRPLMLLERPRLNAAHFLLASILAAQPAKGRASELFKTRGAFTRLILTTNFDPFLQTALQAVNRLYFMSDRPELGIGDEIFVDQSDANQSDAIHLVYLHGSIHRRSQAATDQDIEALKQKNAETLCPVLKQHGVIVLGYSGWDDTVAQALAACDRFDYCLYWCGLEPNPLVEGAFGPQVV